MNHTATETLCVVVERELAFPPEKIWRALTQFDRPQNYQGAKFGWQKFFANLEQLLERQSEEQMA
jgi:hypothetical protein